MGPSSARSSTATGTASWTRSWPRPGSHCRRTGPCRTRRTTSTCCARRYQRRLLRRGSIRGGSSASEPTSPRPRPPPPTASAPLRGTRGGTPLCRFPGLARRPHAYVKLWKHHAAQGQADRINAVARERGEPWLARYGGKISAEWQYAKALQVLEEDPEVY